MVAIRSFGSFSPGDWWSSWKPLVEMDIYIERKKKT